VFQIENVHGDQTAMTEEQLVGTVAETAVPQAPGARSGTGRGLRQPYLTAGGDLVIPFDSDPKYHWWKGGQSVKQTLAEVRTRLEAEKGQGAGEMRVDSDAGPA